MSLYEFGPFKLDDERLLLLHAGEPVALGPKVVETLLALVEHPGEVLAKHALLDRIWPEGYVEEANLAQNIYVLRKTMRTLWQTDPIETVPRRGYRFTAQLRAPQEAVPAPARGRRPFSRAFAGAIAAVAALALLVGAGASYALANRPAPAGVLSAEGSRLYQIGRYYWNLRTRADVSKSLAYFARVIDTDPRDARGYAALADANAVMGDYGYGSLPSKVYFQRARGYAVKALALDPQSAEAHAALGLIALDAHDVKTAVAELQRAIELDPSYGPAHEWRGIALLGAGRLSEGYRELQTAADLDPLSVATTAWLGSAAYLDRRYNDAIAYSRQALDLSPQRTDVLATIGEAYEAQGELRSAIDTFKRYGSIGPQERAEAAALLAHVYALDHRLPIARAELAYARAHANDVEPGDLAVAEAAVGERTVAVELLRRLHSRMEWMAIRNDPRFDALRGDAAFRALAQEPA